MKINTRFNIDDTAYILSSGNCYKVKVVDTDISIEKTEEWEETNISYTVDRFIPKGLLKVETERDEYGEHRLFKTKQECKDILETLARAKKEKQTLNEKIEGLERATGQYQTLSNMSSMQDAFYRTTTFATGCI